MYGLSIRWLAIGEEERFAGVGIEESIGGVIGIGGEKLICEGGRNTERGTRDLGVEAEAQASGSYQGEAYVGGLARFSCVCGYCVRVFQASDVELIERKRQGLSLCGGEGCSKGGGYSALCHHIDLRTVEAESHNA